jgi:UPF0716 protein FxsA
VPSVLPLLVVIFVAVPIIELFVILQVGQAIGVLPTIALLVVDSILGSLLMRSQGRAAWARFNAALAARRVPAREVVDGVLIVFGGALLLTPGFVTDVLGLSLLLPPTRALLRGVVVRRVLPRMLVTTVGGTTRGRPRPGPGPVRDHDVEGSASDVDPPPRSP